MGLQYVSTVLNYIHQLTKRIYDDSAHKHLVQWGLDQGYTIEVACEAETEYVGTDYNEAIEAIEATEYGAIHFNEGKTHKLL